jgi:lactoylglutathione lyase
MNFNLTHIRLLVRDMAASVKFYRDVLGLKVAVGGEDDVYTEFESGNCVLALYGQSMMSEVTGTQDKPAKVETQDKSLIWFGVENVDETYRELSAKGVEFVVLPTDRKPWGLRTAHFRDPDGNLIEIGHGIPME